LPSPREWLCAIKENARPSVLSLVARIESQRRFYFEQRRSPLLFTMSPWHLL
jgi:hypothetical protein